MDVIDLISALQAGDDTAFTSLVQLYQDMAFGYAVALVGDFHIAQDVVQEAFIIAYFNLARLQSPIAFPNWLRTIVRHQCGRALRKRRQTHLPLDQIRDLPTPVPSPDDQAIAHEIRDHTLTVINALPEAQRVAVILFYVYDYSQQEVAAFLGVPVTTVNNRLHSARQRLKREMLSMAKDTFATHGLPDDFATNIGSVVAAHGPIIDVRFAPDDVPTALSTLSGERSQSAHVVQHIGNDTVRCVLIAPDQPINNGAALRNTGSPATSPVSAEAAHQLIKTIHQGDFQQPQILETGIKIIDLLCPYVQGGKIGVFGDMRAGKIAIMEELLHNLAARNNEIALLAFAHTEDVAKSWYGHIPVSTGPVQTIYIPATDPADAAYVAAFNDLDAVTYVSRSIGNQQIWPAVDPLASTSRALDPAIVGEEHYVVAQAVRALLAEQQAGATQETDQTQRHADRAQKIRAFFSQPFFIAEPYTGRTGRFVPRSATVQAFKAILAGTYDDLPVEAFLYCGMIEEAVENAKAM